MATVSGAPFAGSSTGIPNSDDYLLGRGELYYAELTAADVPDANGFLHLGNCRELELSASSEFLEHYSSMTGAKTLDYKVLLQQKFDMRFVLEEINEANAGLWLSATPAAHTNTTIAGFGSYAHTTAAKLGRWYPIVNSSGVRAYGIDEDDLTVTKTSGGTPLVKNVDWVSDEPGGRIKFLTTGVVIVDGDSVTIALAANPLADTTRQLPVQSRTSVNVALAFYGLNPKTSRKYELFVPKIALAADGGFGLIGEQLVGMSFSGSAEKKDSTTAVATITALPLGGVT